MRYLALYVFCLTQIALSTVQANGRYTVVGPGTLHSKHVYTAAVAVHDVTVPCQIKVGITGPEYNETQIVDLQPNDVKNVDFQVPALEYGEYNLTAEGITGIEFKNTSRLHLDNWSAHVKIQTDRGIYKPGDIVNFRVLFLDENLKPSTPDKDAVIWFEDGKRNRIKEFKNFDLVKGVFTDKLQLSNFPVLGDWRLIVKNGQRQNDQAYFSVEKYVLPKYEVKVESNENVAVQDGDMQVIVRANYTYGKPVNGKVTLLLNMNVYYYDEDENNRKPPPETIIKSADMVNGKAKFDLNVKHYEVSMPNNASSYYLGLTATVDEEFTGVKLNGTGGTSLWPYRYHLNCISYDTCSSFKANEEFEVAYKVLYVDYTEVKDTKSPIRLTYTEKLNDYRWRNANETTEEPPKSENKTFTFESHMNESSIVVFKIKLTGLENYEGYSHFYEVSANYAGENHVSSAAFEIKPPTEGTPKEEPPKKWFSITPDFEGEKYAFQIGKAAKLIVNSSEPLDYIIYHVIGRGNILHSERVDLPKEPKLYNLTIMPTFLMSPYAYIYVYYMDKQGELHFEEATFSVEVEFQNKIDITLPTEPVKPGADVPLKIKTAPNSFVGLMAVDQSALMLRSNNDLDSFEFTWRLGKYSTRTPYQGGFSRYPGQYTGVLTLTNADYPYNRTSPYESTSIFNSNNVNLNQTFFGPGAVYDTAMHKVALEGTRGGVAPSSSLAPGTAGLDGGGSIVVRKNFQETWIFANIENTEQEEFTWTAKIPDTITSWLLTGFSLNEAKGLGVANSSTIKTFQPFFISVRLPYSVKRGEVIDVPALVFNYLDKDLDVDVTLDNPDDEYEFIEPTNEVINETKRKKSVRVPANEATGVSFKLRPKTLGNIMLKFSAVSPIAGDAIHKSLKVEPEGVTEYVNRAYLVNLNNNTEFQDTFELDLPKDFVPDSQHTEFAVVGDFLGPVLNNLDNLIRMPMGCGEQTISRMVPQYLVYNYLKAIHKLTPQKSAQIQRNLEHSYQHALAFRHNNGAFSSFGPSTDPKYPINGSTWLTAYVVRSLHEIKPLINVDETIIEQGLKFLANTQAENGSFIEHGDFFYQDQRQHLSLTATVLLAFLENKQFSDKYQSNIDNGFKYLLENMDQSNSVYGRALATYTLKEANHNLSQEHAAKLKPLAKTKDDIMWWSQRDTIENSRFWWKIPYRGEVETTSYVLLTFLSMDTENEQSLLPILKWLVAQRNSFGGFSSSQDTVVGLRALIKFAIKYDYTAAEMDVFYKSVGNTTKENSIKVNNDNALLYQNVELPEGTTSINFNAKGKGAALMQVAYQYNVLKKDIQPSFKLDTKVNEEAAAVKLELIVCVEYTGEGEGSNMALLEISLPSGYEIEGNDFDRIKGVKRVRNVETKNDNTVLVVYFESLHKAEPQCIPVEAAKTFDVAEQKPASIVAYDYYDPSQRATDFYQKKLPDCNKCAEGDEKCQNKCL